MKELEDVIETNWKLISALVEQQGLKQQLTVSAMKNQICLLFSLMLEITTRYFLTVLKFH